MCRGCGGVEKRCALDVEVRKKRVDVLGVGVGVVVALSMYVCTYVRVGFNDPCTPLHLRPARAPLMTYARAPLLVTVQYAPLLVTVQYAPARTFFGHCAVCMYTALHSLLCNKLVWVKQNCVYE